MIVQSKPFGMQVQIRAGKPKVVRVVDDLPAAKLGIKRGDVVAEVAGIQVNADNWFETWQQAIPPFGLRLNVKATEEEARESGKDDAPLTGPLGPTFRVQVRSSPFGMRMRAGTNVVAEAPKEFPAFGEGVRPGCELVEVAGSTVSAADWLPQFQRSLVPFEIGIQCPTTALAYSKPIEGADGVTRMQVNKLPFGMNVENTPKSTQGVVTKVLPGFPAELAGVEAGMQLVEVNGQAVTAQTWYAVFASAVPPFSIGFKTGARADISNIGVGELDPELKDPEFSKLANFIVEKKPFGMEVQTRAGKPKVVRVIPEFPAAKLGIKRGDIVVEVGGIAVTSETWVEMWHQAVPPFGLKLRVASTKEESESDGPAEGAAAFTGPLGPAENFKVETTPFGMQINPGTAKVAAVQPGRPAASQGVRQGCELVSVKGEQVNAGTWLGKFQSAAASLPFEIGLRCPTKVSTQTAPERGEDGILRVTITQKPFGMNVENGAGSTRGFVTKVLPGFPAELAGVEVGFEIEEVNGAKVDAHSWYKEFAKAELPFVVGFRTGASDMQEVLNAGSDLDDELKDSEFSREAAFIVQTKPFGMQVQIRAGKPKVVRVVDGLPAAALGIKRGDTVWEVGGMKVTSDNWFETWQQAIPPFGLKLRVAATKEEVEASTAGSDGELTGQMGEMFTVVVDQKPFGMQMRVGSRKVSTAPRDLPAFGKGIRAGCELLEVNKKPVDAITWLEAFSSASPPFPIAVQCPTTSEAVTKPELGQDGVLRIRVVKAPFGMNVENSPRSPKGVVTKVLPGFPAELAGVQAGYQIVEVDGHEVTAQTWYSVFSQAKIPFTIGFRTLDAAENIKHIEDTQDQEQEDEVLKDAAYTKLLAVVVQQKPFGMEVQIRGGKPRVVRVVDSLPAAGAGIQRGDVVEEVGGMKVTAQNWFEVWQQSVPPFGLKLRVRATKEEAGTETDDDLFTGPLGEAQKFTVKDSPFGMGMIPGSTKVGTVPRDYPAYLAGIRPGCELAEVKGQAVNAGTWLAAFTAAAGELPFDITVRCPTKANLASKPERGADGILRLRVAEKPFGMNVENSPKSKTAVVTKVLLGFPAELAGVVAGYQLVEVAGQLVDAQTWYEKFAKAELPFTIGFNTSSSIDIGAMKQESEAADVDPELKDPEFSKQRDVVVQSKPFGMQVQIREGKPKVVRAVEGFPASSLGIKRGDIVAEVGGLKVTAENWFEVWQQAVPPFGLKLLVRATQEEAEGSPNKRQLTGSDGQKRLRKADIADRSTTSEDPRIAWSPDLRRGGKV
mmetsp:Transcript_24644/g.62849  ORF Transcript_24644/g.62849 Transcript_24644/m.62849 type:complete len:1286 (+) Transcript_24644:2087-5944(+)